MSIRFYPHRKKTIGEKHKIYCRITLNRKKSELYTGLAILPGAWDNEKRKTNNVDINAELSELESKLFRIRRDLIDKDIPLTSSNIVDYYKGHKSTKFFILEYFDAHVQFIKNKGEHSIITISQYGATHKILIKFIRNHLKKNDLLLPEVNYNVLEELDRYMLIDYKDPYNRNIQRNTINKHHSRLRTILNKAINEDLIIKSPYRKFKLRYKKTKRAFLTTAELEKFKKLDLRESKSLDKVRDYFLFSCYTGLRFMDANTLKISDIISDEENRQHISIKMRKTQDFAIIPLIVDAQNIIRKYRDQSEQNSHEFILPRISNQKLNAYLKVLANLSGIDKVMTHHVARHTFATQALNKGIPIEVIQKLLGHTDIQTTQIYAKMLTSTITKEMEKMGKLTNN
jgi:integrase/recombinase XerD